MERKNIAVFFTGGTIGMVPSQDAPGVVPGGAFEHLLAESCPDMEHVRLAPVPWADKPSPHMTPQDMLRLALDVERALTGPDSADGAVVLHGTDVLVESAFLCDLVLEAGKPVIFTGSMRYYTEVGYDGLRNLANAVRGCLAAPSPSVDGEVCGERGLGAALLMTDRFYAARDVIKVDSLNVDAFGAGDAGVLGRVAGETVRWSASRAPLHRPALRPAHMDAHVPLITSYTGMDGSVVDALRDSPDKGMDGLVLEGFGAGNVPPSLVEPVQRCLDNGLPVVLATRCIEGGVWPVYGYPGGGADLMQRGVIPCGRLGGPKARLLLMAALGADMEGQAIQEQFARFA